MKENVGFWKLYLALCLSTWKEEWKREGEKSLFNFPSYPPSLLLVLSLSFVLLPSTAGLAVAWWQCILVTKARAIERLCQHSVYNTLVTSRKLKWQLKKEASLKVVACQQLLHEPQVGINPSNETLSMCFLHTFMLNKYNELFKLAP